MSFTFIDLFAGIGGLSLPFRNLGGTCLFASDHDKYAQKTYVANYSHFICGDITKIDAKYIPPHDVLLAGFPCQPFSIGAVPVRNWLGRAHGFLDTISGTLFFDVARIIVHHRPRAFLLENVPNLKHHDHGRTFEIVLHTLIQELGYHVHETIISSHPWVPQRRKRIYIVGFRDSNNFTFDTLPMPPRSTWPTMKHVLHVGDVSDKYTLGDATWKSLQSHAAKHRLRGNGFGYSLVGPDDVARCLSARYGKDGSEILVRMEQGNPRKLTPRECARLMGFDDDFIIPVSDSQAYHQFGNSVVVPVVGAIAAHMMPFLFS